MLGPVLHHTAPWSHDSAGFSLRCTGNGSINTQWWLGDTGITKNDKWQVLWWFCRAHLKVLLTSENVLEFGWAKPHVTMDFPHPCSQGCFVLRDSQSQCLESWKWRQGSPNCSKSLNLCWVHTSALLCKDSLFLELLTLAATANVSEMRTKRTELRLQSSVIISTFMSTFLVHEPLPNLPLVNQHLPIAFHTTVHLHRAGAIPCSLASRTLHQGCGMFWFLLCPRQSIPEKRGPGCQTVKAERKEEGWC